MVILQQKGRRLRTGTPYRSGKGDVICWTYWTKAVEMITPDPKYLANLRKANESGDTGKT
jgi:hypothetical protein